MHCFLKVFSNMTHTQKNSPLFLLGLFFVLLFIGCKDTSSNGLGSFVKEETAEKSSSKSVANFSKGASAPKFSLYSLAQKKLISLSDYKGKLLIVNFWATWCAPCLAEMPALNRLQQLYASRNLQVITINVDQESERSKVEKFITKNKYGFEVLIDDQASVAQLYSVNGFPETFFISPTGDLLEFEDPFTGDKFVRVIADRPWDSPEYLKAIEKLL